MLAVNVKTMYQQLIYEATHVAAEQRSCGGLEPTDSYDLITIHLANGNREEIRQGDIYVMCEGKTVAQYHLWPINETTQATAARQSAPTGRSIGGGTFTDKGPHEPAFNVQG